MFFSGLLIGFLLGCAFTLYLAYGILVAPRRPPHVWWFENRLNKLCERVFK